MRLIFQQNSAFTVIKNKFRPIRTNALRQVLCRRKETQSASSFFVLLFSCSHGSKEGRVGEFIINIFVCTYREREERRQEREREDAVILIDRSVLSHLHLECPLNVFCRWRPLKNFPAKINLLMYTNMPECFAFNCRGFWVSYLELKVTWGFACLLVLKHIWYTTQIVLSQMASSLIPFFVKLETNEANEVVLTGEPSVLPEKPVR